MIVWKSSPQCPSHRSPAHRKSSWSPGSTGTAPTSFEEPEPSFGSPQPVGVKLPFMFPSSAMHTTVQIEVQLRHESRSLARVYRGFCTLSGRYAGSTRFLAQNSAQTPLWISLPSCCHHCGCTRARSLLNTAMNADARMALGSDATTGFLCPSPATAETALCLLPHRVKHIAGVVFR
jgi:hypothetical protein